MSSLHESLSTVLTSVSTRKTSFPENQKITPKYIEFPISILGFIGKDLEFSVS